jgi:hypothetical protein
VSKCTSVPRNRNVENQPLPSTLETTNYTHARCMRPRAILSRTQVHNPTARQPEQSMDCLAGSISTQGTHRRCCWTDNHWEMEVGSLEVSEGSGRRKMVRQRQRHPVQLSCDRDLHICPIVYRTPCPADARTRWITLSWIRQATSLRTSRVVSPTCP